MTEVVTLQSVIEGVLLALTVPGIVICLLGVFAWVGEHEEEQKWWQQ